MAKNPTFNLKTGADSDLIVAREETNTSEETLGKIKRRDGLYRFPYLTRRTGDTLTGTTENIESNELRHGRTKSAAQKGTSSASGDINFEFSAETFDDMMEAAFRGKWKRWKSDTNSPSNKKGNTYADGYFDTKCAETSAGKKLIGTDASSLIRMANAGNFIIHELNSETDDIKYSLLRKLGGQTDEDLWQEFEHMAVNNMQLSVQINSIITGSFGFMGANNPKLLDSDETVKHFETRMDSISNNDDLIDREKFSTTATYAVGDMVLYETDGYCYKCHTAVSSAGAWTGATNWTKLEAYDYFDAIPDHATDTVQYTARQGFLYLNGEKIEFAQNLSFTLDNGITQKFAILVPNSISSTPLELDITGDLTTYVVGGSESKAKKIFNNAVDNGDVELLFCLQDKLDDPTSFYVFQIFKAKHTDNSVTGNGSDTFDESLPWQSYGEQACRVFKALLPRFTEAKDADVSSSGYSDAVVLTPNTLLESTDLTGIKAFVSVDGGTESELSLSASNMTLETDATQDDYGLVTIKHGVEQTSSEQSVSVRVTWNGFETTRSFTIPAS